MKSDPQGSLHPVIKWFRASRFSVVFSLMPVKLIVKKIRLLLSDPGQSLYRVFQTAILNSKDNAAHSLDFS